MNDTSREKLDVVYLARIIIGLVVLLAAVAVALSLPFISHSISRYSVLIILAIFAFSLIPAIRFFYRRMDEMQKLIHQSSSTMTLAFLAFAAFVVGVLQSAEIIPRFNEFWSFGVIVVVWGINLMLSDKHYK
ncbi:MAG: hypothetical protein B0W54_19550 [Cellvibrio sp. 79]|nr:MAG: hypothetical protein B0W54_19550 [Cellvibrio sp. 79]